MKMVFLPSSILVLLYAFPSARLVSAQPSSSGTYTFSNDVTSFIPSCALSCFNSFVQENYPMNVCSSTPSLECLCSHTSTSGYTVGEGALQCIISEDNVGFCHGANATAVVVADAYNMCSGKSNAQPNTHATITATLVVQTSAPSIVLVASTSTLSTLTSSITSLTSVPTTTSLTTTDGSPTGSLTLSITSDPTAQGQSAQTSVAPSNLTAPQITGIAVGSTAVLILAIGGIIIFGFMRRKRMLRDDGESDFGTFQEDHGNSMEAMFRGPVDKKQGGFAPGGTRSGLAARLAPPIPPPPVLTDPNMFSRRSIPTDEIGVAISPEVAQGIDGGSVGAFGRKHSSRLLPDKPALPKLNLVVPDQSIPEPWHPRPPLAGDEERDDRRDSAATQFDLDITSPVEFSRNLTNFDYGYAYPHEHGGPQLPGNWQQKEPPRSMTAPIQIVPKPLDIRKTQSHQSFSKPLRTRTGSSSKYTGRESLAPSDSDDMPRNGQQQQSYRTYNPYEKNKRESTGSLTSIESAAQVDYRLPEIRTADLSPVVESPTNKSPMGVSPVSYPKIRNRMSDQMVREMVPPKQPVFGLDPFKLDPSHQQDLDQERRRRKETRDSIPLAPAASKISRSDVAPSNHEPFYGNGTRKPLAARRGKGLAPAIDLDKEFVKKKTEQKWRVLPEDNEELRRASMVSQQFTPKRVGEDLYLM